MAVSGSRNFITTTNRILTNSLLNLGVLDPGNSPDALEMSDLRELLNQMVLSWQNKGVFLWTVSEDLQLLTASTASYTLDADIIDILNPIYRKDDTDRIISMITREEYYSLATKKTDGAINQLYFDTKLAAPVIYLWPRPENTTTVTIGTDSNKYLCIKNHTSTTADKPIIGLNYATYWESTSKTANTAWLASTDYKSDILRFSKVQRLQDFGVGSDNPDFPVRWIETLHWNLSVKAAPRYGKSGSKIMNDIRFQAALTFQEAMDADSENADTLTIEPELVRL